MCNECCIYSNSDGCDQYQPEEERPLIGIDTNGKPVYDRYIPKEIRLVKATKFFIIDVPKEWKKIYGSSESK